MEGSIIITLSHPAWVSKNANSYSLVCYSYNEEDGYVFIRDKDGKQIGKINSKFVISILTIPAE